MTRKLTKNVCVCRQKKQLFPQKNDLWVSLCVFAGCAVCAVGLPDFFSLCGGRKTKFLPMYQNPFLQDNFWYLSSLS